MQNQTVKMAGRWVLEIDIRKFLISTTSWCFGPCGSTRIARWILLYLKRWLEAPAQLEDGTLVPRTKGTPQGGVVSPLVANIFLHLAFDDWMRRVYPDVPFERYADDIVAHCADGGRRRSRSWRASDVGSRSVELEVHPGKTRIVYCKDDDRSRGYPQERFDFLGYTFRPRRSKNRWGKFFINFTPAVSN